MEAIESTDLGVLYHGEMEDWKPVPSHKPQLILTSPPFGIDEEYDQHLRTWMGQLATWLPDEGSLVVVHDNCWVDPGVQTFEHLWDLEMAVPLQLNQTFTLLYDRPHLSPSVELEMAEYTKENGKRLPDVHGHALWFSRKEPKVNRRPGQGSSILANMTDIDLAFEEIATAEGHKVPHSVMPLGVPVFFIDLLTDSGDLVLDPFAGTNSTGVAAGKMGRRWVSIEADDDIAAMARWRWAMPKTPIHVPGIRSPHD